MSLLTLDTSVSKEKLASVLRYGGLPLSAHQVTTGVKECLGLADVSAAKRAKA